MSAALQLAATTCQPRCQPSAHLRVVHILVDQEVLGTHNHATCNKDNR